MHNPSGTSGTSTRQFLLCVLLLWLAGNGLRITILAVPPVIPLIRADLGMSETMVGILTGLPPVLFACTAVLGSLLIARFGALNTLIFGLIATAAGSADVLVRGGSFFPEFTAARLSGCSLGGSFLKLRSVHLGFCIEFALGTRVIVTSPVRDISIAHSRTNAEVM